MKNINKKIRRLKKQYKIKDAISAKDIIAVITKIGYELQPYTPQNKNDPPAFTYEKDGKRIVYYDMMLSENDLLIALTHEAAHIFLNHTHRHNGCSDTGIYKEYEANVFTYKLLEWKQLRQKYILWIISLVVCFTIAFLPTHFKQNTIVTTNNINDIQEVVLPSSSNKYHLPNCIHVRNKKDTLTITKSEAGKSGKIPCKVCIGE